MKSLKVAFLVIFACTSLTYGASSNENLNYFVPIVKEGKFTYDFFDKPAISLLDAGKLAIVDEVATAAGIDLKTVDFVDLVSVIREFGNEDLFPLITASMQNIHALLALHKDTVTFIKRCATTFNRLPEDLKKECFLAECDASHCAATRLTRPAVREMFERMITQAVEPRYIETYCAFAPGGLLQDLNILKQLNKQGKQVRTIIIVDTSYKGIIDLIPSKKDGSFYYPATRPVADPLDYAMLKRQGLSFKDLIRASCLAKIIQQFTEQIASHYPTFEGLYVYSNAEAYLTACRAAPAMRADLLVSCDIQHEDTASLSAEWQKAWDDYHRLEGNCLSMSSLAGLLTTSTVKRDRVYMRVKATTGMQGCYRLADSAGIREVSETEQKQLEEKQGSAVKKV